MIAAIEYNNPAIVGIVDLVEKHFGENGIDDQWKKSLGAWVAFILYPFGYVKTYQKKLGNKSSKFSSASCYCKSGMPCKKLVIRYEVLDY